MPTVTPCATAVRRHSAFQRSATTRAFGRHFGDVLEAPSYLRISGVWRSVSVPSQDLIDSADVFIQGGHATLVTTAVADELTAAGLCYATITVPATDGYVDIYTDIYA